MSLDAGRSAVRLEWLDRWLGACLTLGALVWLWLVRTYVPDIRTEGEPGPRGFPLLLGGVLAGLGALMAFRAFRGARKGADTTQADAVAPVSSKECAVAGGTFALLILYAFLLDKVGFIIGTPVVMALAMAGLLRMGALRVASIAIGFTFACWLVFNVLLATPLPRGTWMMWR